MFKKLVFMFIFIFCSSAVYAMLTLYWPVSGPTDHFTIDDFNDNGVSGIVYEAPLLYAVDDGGRIASFDLDGNGMITKDITSTSNDSLQLLQSPQQNTNLLLGGEDVEAVASNGIGGPFSYLYVGLERRTASYVDNQGSHTKKVPQIWQLYKSTMQTTGWEWLLDMPTEDGAGMEGLTWVPNGSHAYGNSASGGLFFASSQSNGTIYVYDIDLSTSGIPYTPNSLETSIASFTPNLPSYIGTAYRKDISDLYFDPIQKLLYVVYDTADVLVLIDPSATSYNIVKIYALPTSADDRSDEGVTVLPSSCLFGFGSTTLYLANDEGIVVEEYSGFPKNCITTSNNSEFVSQTSVPTNMETGETAWVSVKFKNTGISTWQQGVHLLGARPGTANYTWGFSRFAANFLVGPGKNAYFDFQITAPSTPGTYVFQWSLIEGQDWFGEISEPVNIVVSGNSCEINCD